MIEGEPKQSPELLRSEQVKQEVLKYFAGEKAGSAKLTAFFDYCYHRSLEHQRERNIQDLVDPKNVDAMQKARTESSLRITEMKLALVENKMDENSSRVMGYDDTIYELDGVSEDLSLAIIEEIRINYPGIEDEQTVDHMGVRIENAWSDIRTEVKKQIEY